MCHSHLVPGHLLILRTTIRTIVYLLHHQQSAIGFYTLVHNSIFEHHHLNHLMAPPAQSFGTPAAAAGQLPQYIGVNDFPDDCIVLESSVRDEALIENPRLLPDRAQEDLDPVVPYTLDNIPNIAGYLRRGQLDGIPAIEKMAWVNQACFKSLAADPEDPDLAAWCSSQLQLVTKMKSDLTTHMQDLIERHEEDKDAEKAIETLLDSWNHGPGKQIDVTPQELTSRLLVRTKIMADWRLLEQERNKTCSGRDELCRSVLNDEWASHPTWASEDSGFIAHKKNSYEEALHRIEEERHDYDFNIETCARTIQLLEPLAQQLANMSDQEQKAFQLPHGLGGQSESIYKRVIYKCYGRSKGNEVVEHLTTAPYVVIPVLLNRLKERKESWQLAQREWEKVWRDQTQRMFWKSLDHQHIAARSNDKRAFQIKTLQIEISIRREELKRLSHTRPSLARVPQLSTQVVDMNVVTDAAHLVLLHLEASGPAMTTEHHDVMAFFREFIPTFFGIDIAKFNADLKTRYTAAGTVDDDEQDANPEPRAFDNKTLKHLKNSSREGSLGSPSRATTPGEAIQESAGDTEPHQDVDMGEAAETQWLNHPQHLNLFKGKTIDLNLAYERTSYTLWGNTSIYCMVRCFLMLYERLLKIQEGEDECRAAVQQVDQGSAAKQLGLIDRSPQEFFDNTGPNADYYKQMLHKFEDVINQKLDFTEVEETLRRFYLASGYGMYGFEKMVAATGRYAFSVISSDSKERGQDMFQLFKRDRAKDTTTAGQQTDYRKSAEKLLRDSELYRIVWVSTMATMVRLR